MAASCRRPARAKTPGFPSQGEAQKLLHFVTNWSIVTAGYGRNVFRR